MLFRSCDNDEPSTVSELSHEETCFQYEKLVDNYFKVVSNKIIDKLFIKSLNLQEKLNIKEKVLEDLELLKVNLVEECAANIVDLDKTKIEFEKTKIELNKTKYELDKTKNELDITKNILSRSIKIIDHPVIRVQLMFYRLIKKFKNKFYNY